MGHWRNARRIRKGELCAAEVKRTTRKAWVLILTFCDGKQKAVREKDWHRYRMIEVLMKLEKADLGKFMG